MRILFLLFLFSCSLHPVIHRTPASNMSLQCREYSLEHEICKENNRCFFLNKDEYTEVVTEISCDYFLKGDY